MNPLLIVYLKRFLLNKILWVTVVFFLSCGLMYYKGYQNAKIKYFKEQEIQLLQAERDAKTQELLQTQKLLEQERTNVKIVTKYQTLQENIQKDVIKNEKQIKDVYNNKPIEYMPTDIISMLNQTINGNQISIITSSSSVDATSKKSSISSNR